jgi:hypothetical protein
MRHDATRRYDYLLGRRTTGTERRSSSADGDPVTTRHTMPATADDSASVSDARERRARSTSGGDRPILSLR